MADYFNQESERLIYRAVTLEDAEPWAKFFTNNPNLPYMGVPVQGTPIELGKWWMENQFKRYKEHGIGHLATCLKETNELIGMVGLLPKEIDDEPVIEIGYSLLPRFWRKGYGTEMAQQLKRFGKAHRNDGKYISMIHPDNVGSQKVARANGMVPLRDYVIRDLPVIIFGEE